MSISFSPLAHMHPVVPLNLAIINDIIEIPQCLMLLLCILLVVCIHNFVLAYGE